MHVPKFLSVYWLRIKIQKMQHLFEKKKNLRGNLGKQQWEAYRQGQEVQKDFTFIWSELFSSFYLSNNCYVNFQSIYYLQNKSELYGVQVSYYDLIHT